MTTTDKDLNALRRTGGGCPSKWSPRKYVTVAADLLGLKVETFKVDRSTAYRLTNVDGEVYELTKRPQYRVITFYDKATRAFLSPKAIESAACVRLGVLTLSAEAEAKAAAKKTSERRFTCQCCFGEFKTEESAASRNFGNIVDHGFAVPGTGVREGQCRGVNHLPLEVSCNLTAMIQYELLTSLDDLDHQVAAHDKQGVPEAREAVREYFAEHNRLRLQRSNTAWRLKQIEARLQSYAPTHVEAKDASGTAVRWALL